MLSEPHLLTPSIGAPIVFDQPKSQLTSPGSAVNFGVGVHGAEPFGYRWRFNSQGVAGGTNESLMIDGVTTNRAGLYDVEVTNKFGTTLSTAAELAVSPTDGTPLIGVNGLVRPSFTVADVASVQVVIATAIASPTVFFTLDGSPPGFNSAVYAGPFPVASLATIRAIAYDAAFNSRESAPVSVTFVLTPPLVKVEGVVAAQHAFTNVGSVLIEISSPHPTAGIFYTLDGTVPDLLSRYYTGPFSVTNSLEIRAMARTPELESASAGPVKVDLWQLHSLTAGTAGGGIVTHDPPGTIFRNDAQVTLTATPAPGWFFLRWIGDAVGSNAVVTVPMSADRNVQAVFGTPIVASVVGDGSVRFNLAMAFHPYGSSVQAIAVPGPGRFFALWGGAASGNVNPGLVRVTNASPNVSALFADLPSDRFALTVIPNGKGSIAVAPLGNSFTNGQGISVFASAAPGARFYSWTGDAEGKSNSLFLTMTRTTTLTANFSGGFYPLLISTSDHFPGDGFGISLSGEPDREIIINISTNLVDWHLLDTVWNADGMMDYFDPGATNSALRFYRTQQAPLSP